MKIKVPGHHHLVPFGFSRVEVVEILNALFGSIFAYGLNLTLGLLRSIRISLRLPSSFECRSVAAFIVPNDQEKKVEMCFCSMGLNPQL